MVSNFDDGRPSQITTVLQLVRDLTGRAIQSESAAELFGAAFHTLFDCMSFDVAAAVLLEQDLELYLVTREDAQGAVGQELVETLRKLLATVIPAEFTAGDVLVRSERHDLPPAEGENRNSLQHQVHSLLQQGDRAAGLIVLWREEPFSADDQHVLEICSIQVSIHFTNLRSRERIVALADLDDLTGVPNRRFFRRQLTQEIERSNVYNLPLSLLIIDVDDFKEINDAFGHATGDVVLSELCGVIQEMLRTPDRLSRLGGDEFAVILPHTDLAGACAVAERVLARVRNMSISVDEERSLSCSVSIGAAQFSAADATLNDLIRRGDDRLYEAKRQGKNRYTS